MAEFKIGDRVKILRGPQLGKLCTVLHLPGKPDINPGLGYFVSDGETFGDRFAPVDLALTAEEPVFGGTLATAHGGPDFAGIAAELVLLLKERHEKYGPTNIANAYGGPMNGLLVRMGDKFARLQHGLDEHKDESVDDTLWDIAGYALIALLVRRGEWPGC